MRYAAVRKDEAGEVWLFDLIAEDPGQALDRAREKDPTTSQVRLISTQDTPAHSQ